MHLIKSSGTPGMCLLCRGHTHHRGPCNFCPLPLFFQYSGLDVRPLWPLSFPQFSSIPELGCTRLEHPPHSGAFCRILSSSSWGNICPPVSCRCRADYEGSFPSHCPCPFGVLFPSHLSHPLPASLRNRSSLHCTARVGLRISEAWGLTQFSLLICEWEKCVPQTLRGAEGRQPDNSSLGLELRPPTPKVMVIANKRLYPRDSLLHFAGLPGN